MSKLRELYAKDINREIQGVKFMDLGGVPVKPDITHPSYGVYAFKRSFGGEYKEYDAMSVNYYSI